MQNKKNNISSSIELINISLVCTILALNTYDPLLQVETKIVEQNQILTQNIAFQPTNFLYVYLLSIDTNRSIYELTSPLLQTLDRTFTTNSLKLNNQLYENVFLQQYLRKFTFFYCYYYINVYPNDLSRLSDKKLNMLAIRSLFLIHSI
jgi:hypothetical protein